MWFVGGIVGFIIGVAFESGIAMLILAVLGGYLGHMLGRSNAGKAGKPAELKVPAQAQTNDAMTDMRKKIASLEIRLQSLEREVVSLKVANGVELSDREEIQLREQQLEEEKAAFRKTQAEQSKSAAADMQQAAKLNIALTPSVPEVKTQASDELELNDVLAKDTTSLILTELPLESALVTELSAESDKKLITLDEIEPAPTPAPTPAILTDLSVAQDREAQATSILPPVPVPPVIAKRPPPPPPKTLRESLPAPLANLIFGGNTLVKIGVLILFLGLAFLLRYTAERVTVPVELRYAGVALTGVVLLALGWFLRNKRRDYALILQGMAIGVFYLTTLSAIKISSLISPEAGFGFMFAVSVLSAALAVLQNAPLLAIVAALEGFATPILTSSGENRPLGLFTYLAVLDVGIFLVAWFNAWRVLNLIGFVGTFTLALGWAQRYYTDAQYGIVQPFLIFFFVLFALIGLLFARRTLKEASNVEGPLATLKQVGRVDSALVFGNPVTAFGMQYMLVQNTEFGAAFSALIVGFFYLLLARFVFSKEKQGLALLAEAYVIVAAIFGTLAIPLGLEGTWTGAAWAVEGAGMYWLGIRQQRPYARGFAYLVMVGAAYKLLHGIYLNPVAGPLLQGSWLGPVLLAVSVFVVWNLHRRAASGSQQNVVAAWEKLPNALLPWLGVAAIALLPWMLLTPQFAAAAMAVLALLVSAVASRWILPDFARISATLQALSLISFLLTLHTQAAVTGTVNNQAALADGWRGMLSAAIIAASILFSAGRSMIAARSAAQAKGLPPTWSNWNKLSVVSGCSLLHLAMLFAVDLKQAALIWPLTSCLLLWVGLRMSHIALAALAAALQVIAACIYVTEFNGYHGASFAHLGFLVPLSLAVTAWFSGDRVRAEAVRMRDVLLQMSTTNAAAGQGDGSDNRSSGLPLPVVWLNPWCSGKMALAIPVIWGLGWWLTAWFPECLDTLERTARSEYCSSAAVAITVISSLLMISLAKWRAWPQMAGAAMVTLPLLMLSALIGVSGAKGNYLPSAYLGWLAWPVAFAWHLFALKKQQSWLALWPGLLKLTHIAGFWLFLLLAAREGQAHFEPLADTWSSWPLLGWVLVPALVFWFIGNKQLGQRWPLNTYRKAYIEQACAPVALYLLGWCWLTNAFSAGNASPLPYLPLLNPLELGQWLVLAALLHWWRALSGPTAVKTTASNAVAGFAAATALALLTGMVLRSCHHFAGVPWDADALFASRLSQAAVSITWAICGVAVMLFANRRMSRTIWIAGAALLAVVVLKLFLIELADRGGLYRIVSFIGVGILLLVVGYFAPVPVKPKDASITDTDAPVANVQEEA